MHCICCGWVDMHVVVMGFICRGWTLGYIFGGIGFECVFHGRGLVLTLQCMWLGFGLPSVGAKGLD